MKGVCIEERRLPRRGDLWCESVVHGVRGHQPDARVPVFVVVVAEEFVAEAEGVLIAAETLGESRTVLEGLELGLGVRVVVRDVWPAVRLGDPQRGQPLCANVAETPTPFEFTVEGGEANAHGFQG